MRKYNFKDTKGMISRDLIISFFLFVMAISVFRKVSRGEQVNADLGGLAMLLTYVSINILLFLVVLLSDFLRVSKSWWAGGVVGIIVGVIVGYFTHFAVGIAVAFYLMIMGFFLDYFVSKNIM